MSTEQPFQTSDNTPLRSTILISSYLLQHVGTIQLALLLGGTYLKVSRHPALLNSWNLNLCYSRLLSFTSPIKFEYLQALTKQTMYTTKVTGTIKIGERPSPDAYKASRRMGQMLRRILIIMKQVLRGRGGSFLGTVWMLSATLCKSVSERLGSLGSSSSSQQTTGLTLPFMSVLLSLNSVIAAAVSNKDVSYNQQLISSIHLVHNPNMPNSGNLNQSVDVNSNGNVQGRWLVLTVAKLLLFILIRQSLIMSFLLPHLDNGWEVDQAILTEPEKLVVIRWGHDYTPKCMQMDEIIMKVAYKLSNFVTFYVVDISQVPDFNTMYQLYDEMTLMFFYRNKHIMIDTGTGNNNKINWVLKEPQDLIDICEVIYRGARKGKGLVVAPKDYSLRNRY